ncbi:MAG: HlyD family type I secretion periplasmic adaptor subunit [Beijerinckiaceae bacterium]
MTAPDVNRPDDTDRDVTRSLRRHAIAGFFVVFGLLGGLGIWSAFAQIAGAVIAPGVIAVESNARKVQHPEGGVVAELHVRDGDRVQTGDIVARLDDTLVKANLQIVAKALDEFLALEARLLAERDGLSDVNFPKDLVERAATSTDARASLLGQQTIFKNRRIARESAKTQLSEQVTQLESGIGGMMSQRKARDQELLFIEQELKGVRDLFARNLVPIARVNALERDRTRIDGDRGKLTADIASANGSIAEKKIQMLRIEDDLRSEVSRELADIRNKINEAVEKRTAALDRLKKIDIRATASGQIHQLALHTVGGVISNGETLMLIVPEKDKLIIEAQVEPQDIEHVLIGQKAVVRFVAFSDRNMKDSSGEVVVISPDLVEDQATRRRFYRVRITVDPPTNSDGKVMTLVPGMPVEAHMIKGDRTVLAYLVKPMKDQLQRVWRE